MEIFARRKEGKLNRFVRRIEPREKKPVEYVNDLLHVYTVEIKDVLNKEEKEKSNRSRNF